MCFLKQLKGGGLSNSMTQQKSKQIMGVEMTVVSGSLSTNFIVNQKLYFNEGLSDGYLFTTLIKVLSLFIFLESMYWGLI